MAMAMFVLRRMMVALVVGTTAMMGLGETSAMAQRHSLRSISLSEPPSAISANLAQPQTALVAASSDSVSENAVADPVVPWQPEIGTWQPVPSRREDYGKIKVVWLEGTPYEMGYQHGTLLQDEIASLGQEVIDSVNFMGRGFALGRLSRRRSFPGVEEECQGMVDAIPEVGLTLDGCMVLAMGDVLQEYLTYLVPTVLFNDGCAHFIASGNATADGRMYHGWTLDNNASPMPYWIENPTILVRQPDEGIPHAFITIPGVVWPNAGFNAEGIIVSNNTSHPKDYEDLALQGKSTVQLMGQIAQYASSYDEAYAIMESHDRMRSNLVIVSDAASEQAAVFELLGREMGVRTLSDDGLLYMTNHFADPDVVGRDSSNESSFNRFQSFEQMLEPDGTRSRYGSITPEVIVEILRDRTHPKTGEVSSLDVFDDNASIGGNGSLRQVVFDPEGLRFWLAAGEVPIPENPFTCFSLGEMLNLPNATACPSPAID